MRMDLRDIKEPAGSAARTVGWENASTLRLTSAYLHSHSPGFKTQVINTWRAFGYGKGRFPRKPSLLYLYFVVVGVRVATTELLAVQTRFVPYSASLHCLNRLFCCGSVSIDPFNGITPSGLGRFSGSCYGTTFLLFIPRLPFGYSITEKLNFCNILCKILQLPGDDDRSLELFGDKLFDFFGLIGLEEFLVQRIILVLAPDGQDVGVR